MAALPPDETVASLLDGTTGGGYTLDDDSPGRNVFPGPVRPVATGVAQVAVFCLFTGGVQARDYLGTASGWWPGLAVQVTVRGESGKLKEAEQLAVAAYNTLMTTHFNITTGTAPPEGYIDVTPREPPFYVPPHGADDSHTFRFNVELVREAASLVA